MTALDPFLENDTWQPINLNTLAAKPPIQPTLGRLGEIGLVYPGTRHVFSGPPESAKTLVAYLIIIQVVRHAGDVLLIDFEMGAYNARDRLQDLGATNEDLEHIHYVDPDTPATEDRLQELRETVKPVLVVIDASAGAFDLQGLNDDKRQDVGRIYRLYVEPFWRAGIATIFLDHVVKNTESRGQFAIGSERKVGVADVHLGFETSTPISRGTRGRFKIHTRKDRGGFHKRGILAELELVSDPITHQITYELKPAEPSDEWMPTHIMQKVSEHLESEGCALSKKQIITTIGKNKDATAKAIGHLVRLEYATQTDGERGAHLITHQRRFTVYEWEHTPPTPTYPDLPPGQVHVHLPQTPPYRGAERGRTDGHQNGAPPPDQQTAWSWVDELTPPDPEDDGIPF